MQAIAPDGAIAGETTFYLANNVDDPTPHDAVGVPVTAKPVSAQGYCGAADPDQAIARYEITNLRIKGDHLLGSVIWVGGIDPVEQFCQATFQRSDGTSKVVPFSLMAPEGDQDLILMGPDAVSELTPESVSCEPFAGQPDLTDKINRIRRLAIAESPLAPIAQRGYWMGPTTVERLPPRLEPDARRKVYVATLVDRDASELEKANGIAIRVPVQALMLTGQSAPIPLSCSPVTPPSVTKR